MDLNLPARSPVLAAGLAEILMRQVQGQTPQFRTEQVGNFLNDFVTFEDGLGSNFAPKWSVWWSRGAMLLCLEGAVRTQLATVLGVSYADGPGGGEFLGFVTIARFGGDEILAAIRSFNIPFPTHIIIAGYSYGGVVGLYIAARLKADRVGTRITFCSFGSPKPGDSSVAQSIRGIDVCRYMNEGDAIPHCPPTPLQAFIMYSLSTRTAALSLARFEQAGPAYEIGTNGFLIGVGLPVDTFTYTDLSIASFLIRNESPVAQAHRILEYWYRLSLTISRLPVPLVRQVEREQVVQRFAPPDPVAVGPHAELGGAGPEVVEFPVRLLPPKLSGALDKPYKAYRVGRQHTVYYVPDDVLIAVCKGGKAARLLAGALNTSWRRWNSARAGSAAALGFSVEEAFLD